MLIIIFGKTIFSIASFMTLHPVLFGRSLILQGFYWISNRSGLFRKIFYNGNSIYSNSIVSLTTYHKRIDTVYLTIESIFNQDNRPFEVILWLSEEDLFDGIPNTLKRLKKRGLIIYYLSDNQRSYKKLSYIMNYKHPISNKVEFIITADDDVFYPKYWLNKLETKARNNPNCTICYRGHNLDDIEELGFSYIKNIDNCSSKNTPSKNLFPTGVSGVLYPLNSLDERIYDFHSINNYCIDADDIWYKFVTLSNGFSSVRVEENNVIFPLCLAALKEGLQDFNVGNDANTDKILKTNKFFNNLL